MPLDPLTPAVRRALILLLLLAFGLRLAWLLLVPTIPQSDAGWFYGHAERLAEQGRFVGSNGELTAERLVGYPAILAAAFAVFGTSYNVGKILNLVLSMVMLVASFDIARQTFRSNRIALWTVAILAVFPNHIAYTSALMSEIAFTALFLVAISLMLRLRYVSWLWLPAGVLFGVATLVKSYFALAPLVVWGWLAWRRDLQGYHRRFALVVAVMVLTIMPWLVRNWVVFDAFPVMSNTAGFNLWVGHQPGATGGFYNPLLATYPHTPEGEYAYDQQLRDEALGHIRNNPEQSLRLSFVKAANTFIGNVEGLEAAHAGTDYNFNALAIFTYLLYLVLLIMAMAYPLVRWRYIVHHPDARLPAPELGGLFVLYVMAVAAVFFGDTRFSFPVMPLVFMYSAALIVMLRSRRQAAPESADQSPLTTNA